MFYKRNDGYSGGLPLEGEILSKVLGLFLNVKNSIDNKVDARWSCTTRMFLNNILELLAQQYYKKSAQGNNTNTNDEYIGTILDYIHSNYSSDISLALITELVNVNKTSVNKYFK